MFTLNEIKPAPNSKRTPKRLGRGNGSGKGTFCGKGCKGQKARSGSPGDWFEGGQTPLFRRLPKKRGFSNYLFKKSFNVVTLDVIEKAAKSGMNEITIEEMLKGKFVSIKDAPLKVIWSGTITAKVTVKAAKFTAGAKEAIEKAGWKIEIIA